MFNPVSSWDNKLGLLLFSPKKFHMGYTLEPALVKPVTI